MIELASADAFIKKFEIYGRKVTRIPLTYFSGSKVNLLMSKCGCRWICLPYMSEGVLETQGEEPLNPPFALFESEDGNLCATANVKWEIRDTRAYSNFLYTQKVNFRLPLCGLQTPVLDFFSPNVRRKIKKAENNGLIVKFGGKQYLNHFYKVYSRRMHAIGVPPVSKTYLRKRLICGDYWLFIVYNGKTPIGAASLMRNKEGLMENEFFATDSKSNHFYTSYLLHYSMMQFAHDEHCDYSLGRSTYESSVYYYKMHFKAEQYQLYWSFSYKHKNIRNYKILYRLWKLLPYRFVQWLSPFVYRFIY
ncbi:MAG: hypothetical protein LBL74_05240 [Bacteroidales bacterium]|jgi:hypothetical protein|nr:hypothetical protein [Bacteroidales bacterium]